MTMPVRFRIFLLLLSLMAAAGLSIRLAKPLKIETDPPVRELPGKAGNWTGRPILFCQNDQCGRAWTPEAARVETNQYLCPVCGQQVDKWSLGEKRSLDANTLLFRRQYTNSTDGTLTMTLVVSPPNVNSIHRPQTCIFAQGFRIVRRQETAIPLPGRLPLKLTLLELARPISGTHGQPVEARSFIAYCFMDRSRQTPSHAALTLRLMLDRLVQGRVSRWAYLTISSEWNVDETAYLDQLRDLVRSAAPLLTAETPPPP